MKESPIVNEIGKQLLFTLIRLVGRLSLCIHKFIIQSGPRYTTSKKLESASNTNTGAPGGQITVI